MNLGASIPLEESYAEAPEAAVGRKLRFLRRSRELSLQAVSGMTGVSIGLLSQIERGLSSPSVRNLAALSAAFDVPIGWFFDTAVPVDESERTLIVRREARRRIAMQMTSMTKELLSPESGRALQTFLITIEPSGGTGDASYAYAGEVNGFVLSGQLTLWLEGRSFRLRDGDAFAIPGNCPRRYSNPDPLQPTRLIWSIAS